jgi:uncharacterized membrane protein YfcA
VIDGLTAVELLAATAAVTLGAVVQAATGLGGGLLVVPLLALISLDFVPGPVIFASLALSGLMAWRGRGDIRYEGMAPLLAGIFAGLVAGAVTIRLVPLERAGILFGVLVLIAVAVSSAGVRVPRRAGPLAAAGAAAGYMGTTAGMGAPVLALIYQDEHGPGLRATLAFLYVVSSVLMLAVLHLAGRFGASHAAMGLLLVPGFVLGWLIAAPLARRLDRGFSRAAVLAISAASALLLIARSI